MTATLFAATVFSVGMSMLIGTQNYMERKRRYEALRVMLDAVASGIAGGE